MKGDGGVVNPGSVTDDQQARPDSQRLYRAALARILQRVSDHGGATITELAEVAAVSRPTVQRALRELEGLGVVCEGMLRPSGTGRPARSWEPAIGTDVVLALDIRPTGSRLIASSLTGRAVVDEVFDHRDLVDVPGSGPAPGTPAGADVPRLVLERVGTILQTAGISASSVLETVIGVSGIVAVDGSVLLSNTTPGLTGYPLRDRAAEIVGLTSVQVENDMNLRAMGELRIGVAQGLSSFVYLTNHTFHRPAVVLGGSLLHGHHRTVGEGDVLSRTGVVPATIAQDGQVIDYFEVALRIDDGTLGPEWIPTLHERLAAVIAVLCYTLDPEAVVIHGGPVTTGPAALADLERRFHAFAVTPDAPQVLAAGHGPELAMSGALALALREALSATLGTPDPPIPAFRPSSL